MATNAQELALSTALAIFVKTPGLSSVKTRLAASVGPTAAEQFHRFSAQAVAAVAQAAPATVKPYWAVAENEALEHPDWHALPRIWQGQGDLGARLHQVCSQLQSRHDRVLLIGADAPQITVTLLQQALTALGDPATPFVLGPAGDGGFWLFGTRNPVPAEVWQQVRYSASTTASDLVTALAAHGAVARLPALRDVDTVDDLEMLGHALAALPHPLAAQTSLRQWLGKQASMPGRKGTYA